MHICPAEIGAALLMIEQATLTYWYIKLHAQGFSERLRARIFALKSST